MPSSNARPLRDTVRCERREATGTPRVTRVGVPAGDPSGDLGLDDEGCLCVSRVIRYGMDNISVRELRNNGGRVLQRVAGGETLTVTMDDQPIDELRPLRGRGLTAAGSLKRWRRLPPVDAQQFRSDIDRVFDSSPWSVR
jgi:antitoxin (DNA-binding transcriptional repressor) of toxin-antitoxin stability system